MSVVHGVDGCRKGWIRVSVSLDPNKKKVVAKVFETAEALFNDGPPTEIGIDIPIGLPDTASRKCDEDARKLLKFPRSSSVFPVPMRAALDSTTYKAACDANEKQWGKRLSQQSYAILPKIREVDELLRNSAGLLERVYEVHPEVSFYYWNGKKPMQYSKRCGFGFLERYKLVEKEFPGAALKIRKEHKRSDVADDDILDAIAVVWTARRIHMKEHECIPEGVPERDEMGLQMQMRA